VINFLEEIMKLLKSFMAVALITTALTGSTYAVYDPANQATTSVADLKDIGLASAKKLSITRAGVDAILDARFDATQGANDPAKNAKALLSGVVHGTIDEFAGADEPTKRAAFLAALDKVLGAASPLELDITVAGFNPGTPIAGTDTVKEAVEIFFNAINPVDPREALLRQAHTLGIVGRNADGNTVDDLLADLAGKAGAEREAVLAKAAAKNFGKDGDKSLADRVAERLGHHKAGTGKYAEVGLDGNEPAIGAFHAELKKAHENGVASAKLTADEQAAVHFMRDVVGLYKDYNLSDDTIDPDTVGTNPVADARVIVAAISKLGGQITKLEGQIAKLKSGKK